MVQHDWIVSSNQREGKAGLLHPGGRHPQRLGLQPPRRLQQLRQRRRQVLVHDLLVEHVPVQEVDAVRRPNYVVQLFFLETSTDSESIDRIDWIDDESDSRLKLTSNIASTWDGCTHFKNILKRFHDIMFFYLADDRDFESAVARPSALTDLRL